MAEKIKVAHYLRKNREEAVIYVRGHNQELQEEACRSYAANKGYEVVFVTRNLRNVNRCDVLLIINPSRISRNGLEYYTIVKEFKEKGIRIENAFDADDAGENVSLLMSEMFNMKDK